MPTNLYGPGDNFDLIEAHVLPSLIRKAHEAKARGDARLMYGRHRHAEARVPACGRLRRRTGLPDEDAILATRRSTSAPARTSRIRELTELVCEVVGFRGEIVNDLTIPDGMPRKLMSAKRLRGMGWAPRIALGAGVREYYRWFLDNAVAPA